MLFKSHFLFYFHLLFFLLFTPFIEHKTCIAFLNEIVLFPCLFLPFCCVSFTAFCLSFYCRLFCFSFHFITFCFFYFGTALIMTFSSLSLFSRALQAITAKCLGAYATLSSRPVNQLARPSLPLSALSSLI